MALLAVQNLSFQVRKLVPEIRFPSSSEHQRLDILPLISRLIRLMSAVWTHVSIIIVFAKWIVFILNEEESCSPDRLSSASCRVRVFWSPDWVNGSFIYLMSDSNYSYPITVLYTPFQFELGFPSLMAFSRIREKAMRQNCIQYL